MAQKLYIVFTLALILLEASPRIFHYIYDLKSTSFYKCISQQGFQTIGLPLFSTNKEGFPAYHTQNIMNAKNSGLGIQVVYIPCRARTVDSEIASLQKLEKGLINFIWVYPSLSAQSEGCSWDAFPSEFNCMYLRSLMEKLEKNGFNFGFAADRDEWAQIFGSYESCEQVSSYPLWWSQKKNQEENFDDFQVFGGWQKPKLKIVGERQICNYPALASFYQ